MQKKYVKWKKSKTCRDQGSNQGPLDLQSNALPTELSRLVQLCTTIPRQIIEQPGEKK